MSSISYKEENLELQKDALKTADVGKTLKTTKTTSEKALQVEIIAKLNAGVTGSALEDTF